jgi:hypothetical protein
MIFYAKLSTGKLAVKMWGSLSKKKQSFNEPKLVFKTSSRAIIAFIMHCQSKVPSFHHIAVKEEQITGIKTSNQSITAANPRKEWHTMSDTCLPVENGTYLYLIICEICLLIVRTKSTTQ